MQNTPRAAVDGEPRYRCAVEANFFPPGQDNLSEPRRCGEAAGMLWNSCLHELEV